MELKAPLNNMPEEAVGEPGGCQSVTGKIQFPKETGFCDWIA